GDEAAVRAEPAARPPPPRRQAHARLRLHPLPQGRQGAEGAVGGLGGTSLVPLGARCPSRGGVLGRADSAAIDAPCVLASERASPPVRRRLSRWPLLGRSRGGLALSHGECLEVLVQLLDAPLLARPRGGGADAIPAACPP